MERLRNPLILVLIVLVIGIAYLYMENERSNAQAQQFNPGLVEAKQKCQSDAQQWFKKKMTALTLASNTTNWNDELVGEHFNSRLNTCLVAYMYSAKDGSSQVSQVIDIYQDSVLLELDIDTTPHSPTFGTYLFEDTKPVQIWPWQNAGSEYTKRENLLFEGEAP